MSAHVDTTATSIHPRHAQYARWARLLDSILPSPDPDRLVSLTEVDRLSLSLAEGSLADIGVSPVFSQIPSMNGDSRFTVLVPARQAEVARAALAGL